VKGTVRKVAFLSSQAVDQERKDDSASLAVFGKPLQGQLISNIIRVRV
jgi:hypothetical protein